MTTPSLAARTRLLFAIMMLFVVLGPPIGAVVAWMLLMINKIESPSDVLIEIVVLPFVALIAIPIGYLYGAAPAAVAGLAIGIKQAFFGRTTWPVALGVSLVASAFFLEGLDVLDPGARFVFGDSVLPGFSAIMIRACLVPTLLCWALVRSWCFAPPSSGDAAP